METTNYVSDRPFTVGVDAIAAFLELAQEADRICFVMASIRLANGEVLAPRLERVQGTVQY